MNQPPNSIVTIDSNITPPMYRPASLSSIVMTYSFAPDCAPGHHVSVVADFHRGAWSGTACFHPPPRA